MSMSFGISWMQELQFMKDALKKKLNQALGPGVIQELRFKIGAWEDESKEKEPQKPLPPELIVEAEKAVAVIADPRLREQTLRLLLAAAAREEADSEDKTGLEK